MPDILVFDIETVPDFDAGRRLFGLTGSDAEVAAMMVSLRREETGGESDFLRHHLHRVICISVVLRRENSLKVWSLGEPDSPEDELLRRFFEGLEKYQPTLVSWNGSGFDLPVLHYRLLKHGITAKTYWQTGGEFKWNNYLSRYHERHTDLMDVLAAHNGRASAPLHEMAQLLGFPGKLGMEGSQVREAFFSGGIDEIRAYCETDVLNTYLVYLRFELVRGTVSHATYEDELERVRALLLAEDKPHQRAFLEAWGHAGVK